jgi:1-acyl-sn-glycerol-3-phosphate acyltransferase
MTKINPKELFFYFLKKIFLDKKWLISRNQRKDQIQKTILEKKAVLIYPEGTRSKNGKLLKFRD